MVNNLISFSLTEQEATSIIVLWDGTNKAGAKVNSDIYFYSLQTPQKTIIEKMILTK